MSKTVSTCICETNLIKDQPQENVFFLTLSRKIEDFPNEFLRTARSTSPIQICAIFSTIGPDNLGAILNIELNKELEKIVADFSNQTILDFEAFSNRVVNTLNVFVCNFSANKGVALKTSMTMLVIEGDILRVIHLGITKAVLLRENQILALTEEATVAHRYLKMGAITAEDEKTHPENMNLTQYLGKMPQDGQLIPDKNVNIKLKDGDELFLMGLGVSRKMPSQLRNSAVIKRIPIEDKVKEIMNSAINYGIKSGLTLIGMQVESTFILPGDAVIHSSLASDATVAPIKDQDPSNEFIDFSKPEQSQPARARNRAQSEVNDDTKPVSKPSSKAVREAEEADYPVKKSRKKNDLNVAEDDGTRKFVPGGADYEEGIEEQMIDAEELNAVTSKQKALSILIPVLILIVCILLGFGITFLVFHVRDLLDSNTTQATTTETGNQVLYITSDQTPVYSQAALDSTIIEKLDRGDTVTLVGVEDKFSIVLTANNITGYVLTAQLSDEDPTYYDETSEMENDPTPTPTEETTESTTEETTTTSKATSQATTTTSDTTTTTTTTSDTTTTTTTTTTSSDTTSTTTTTAEPSDTTTPEPSDKTSKSSEEPSSSSSEKPSDKPSEEPTSKATDKPKDTQAEKPASSEKPADTDNGGDNGGDQGGEN
ncbi:MAG: hypothetical protein J5778_04920 [Clostridiales bacterium]|nr:hypothetical protein [Clostridiales bacterium]